VLDAGVVVLVSGGGVLSFMVEAWIQQPETRTPVGFELRAFSVRRFNSPYVETNAPQSAHVTG
jgi:hypothetical protein